MNQHDSLPLVLHPSRSRALLYVLFCTLLVVLGLQIKQPVGAAVWLTLSALGLLMAGVQLVPSLAYLQLPKEGFSYRFGRRRDSVRWSEVDRFGVRKAPGWYGSGPKFVEWIYARRYAELPSTGEQRYTFGGGSAVLPDSYGMKAEELAGLMNNLRKRFVRPIDDDSETELV